MNFHNSIYPNNASQTSKSIFPHLHERVPGVEDVLQEVVSLDDLEHRLQQDHLRGLAHPRVVDAVALGRPKGGRGASEAGLSSGT